MTPATHQLTLQHQSRRHFASALIVFCLLMQSMLAYWVTPMTITHDDAAGQMTIVLCTLQGTRTITIDVPEFAEDEPDYCPALELQHIAGTANITAPPPVLAALQAAIAPRPGRLSSAHRTLHYAAFASRAPPIV